MLDDIGTRVEASFEEDDQRGIYRVARDIFTDPELFELEMKHIFEGNWIYLAHESQIPNKNDYFTTYMGRQPRPSFTSLQFPTCKAVSQGFVGRGNHP
jgi:benzoate/toluate 1,2-dioxygenase alpha subunit